MTLPTLTVELSFTPPTAAPDWVDITDDVMAFSTKRGRNRDLDRFEAGSMSLTLVNEDRRYDPTNTSSVYAPDVVPLKRVRVRATWADMDYPIFAGYIQNWGMPLWRYGRIVAEVDAVDGFALLSMKKVSGTYPQQRTDERISAVLDAAAWSTGAVWVLGDATLGVLGTTTVLGPYGARDLMTGQTTVAADTLDKVSALTAIQEIATIEQGRLFIDRDGGIQFQNRARMVDPAYRYPVAVFGTDQPAELPYADATVEQDVSLIYNEAKVTREGGTEQTVTDAASTAAYFGRTYTLSNAPFLTDYEASKYAGWIVGQNKDATPRISSLSLQPQALPDDLWPQALGREIGDRIEVIHRPPFGSDLDREVIIEGVSHKYDAKSATWDTEWRLTPAEPFSVWVLGDSELGVLGTSTKLGY